MAEFDKWLTTIRADDPVSKVARRALQQRVKAVRHFLKRAEGASSDDLEPVHQMRVWSRRASAAERMFRDLLPRRKARKLKRTLRRLRRLGGEARDCDLLMRSLANDPTTPFTVGLARQLKKRRKQAQRPIDRMKRKLIDDGRLKKQSKKLLVELRWRKRARRNSVNAKEPSFGDWAREGLEELLARFVSFDGTSLQQDDQLHQLRIVGKRLRYAAELSIAAFPRIESDGLYDQLVQLQDRLGDAVDHLAAIGRLETLFAEAQEDNRPYLRESIGEQQRQLAAKKRKFLRWWTTARRRTMESRWRGALRADL